MAGGHEERDGRFDTNRPPERPGGPLFARSSSLPPDEEPSTPEDHLGSALRCSEPDLKLVHAERGLAMRDVEPETRMLLLRQAYLALISRGELDLAAIRAAEMSRIGPLQDIALHDYARVLRALERSDEAILAQREAAEVAPASRKSFHLWSLATLQHFAGEIAGALDTLAEAAALDGEDRPLLDAHRAWIALSEGIAVADLAAIRRTLGAARSARGYGQFVLGMLAFELGDMRMAEAHLRAFLRRNARLDPAKALTLREELIRARAALATFSSS